MPLDRDQRADAPDRRRVTRGGRREYDIGIRDPDACPKHGRDYSAVINKVPHRGYTERRHVCRRCGFRWNSYQTILDPRRIRLVPHHKTT